MKNQEPMVLKFFRQKTAKVSEHTSYKVWGNQRGAESGPERGDPGSASEFVVKKQDCRKTDYAKNPLCS